MDTKKKQQTGSSCPPEGKRFLWDTVETKIHTVRKPLKTQCHVIL